MLVQRSKNSSKIIKIGLDLDNTLIDYSDCFKKALSKLNIKINRTNSKSEIKDFIFKAGYKKKDWMKIQGLAYGYFITNRAKLFKGVLRFLKRSKINHYELIIVSHKTEKGHYLDKSINIRQKALDFLLEKKIYCKSDSSLIKKIKFFNTVSEKVDYINSNNFDIFIDDLPKVLNKIDLNKNIKLFRFSVKKKLTNCKKYTEFNNWFLIDELINGYIQIRDIKLLFKNIKNIKNINEGGNSRTFMIKNIDNVNYKIKFFNSNFFFNKLKHEVNASIFLQYHDFKIPKVLEVNTEFNYVMFEWIDGNKIIQPSTKNLNQFLTFINNLNQIKILNHNCYSIKASASCYSLNDIERQFKTRFKKLNSSKYQDEKFQSFLNQKLYKSFSDYIYWIKNNETLDDIVYRKLQNEELSLSPSDFGLHNSVESSNQLFFFDFEYFGLDDPVKLISDFYYNPSNSFFTDTQKSKWLYKSINIANFSKVDVRLKYHMPLYGLIWCLIILNDFSDDVWSRRIQANQKLLNKRDIVLKNKLSNSINQYNDVIKTINFVTNNKLIN